MSFRTPATDAAAGDLGAVLFASLRRADQRARGLDYLHGLLGAEGRKSIRGIAAAAGGTATEQRLHHFVSESTWDWTRVRRALTGYVADRRPPQAWVLAPLLIPKAGTHSVGVGRHFEARLGHATNAQQAVGVWGASEHASYPLHWRLHLSAQWLADRERRRRAAIPDDVWAEPFATSGVTAFLAAAAWPEWPDRPLVFDARAMDLTATVHRLRRAGVPFLARIPARAPLLAARPGHTADPVPAAAVMAAARDRRRPVSWTELDPSPATRSCLAAAARVRLPGALSADLLLLGTSDLGRPWPDELWLTDLPAANPTDLVRLTMLPARVERDRTEIADQVGLRDFAGRSFAGWHRHVTLVSAAHALVVLTRPANRIRRTG